VKDLFGKNVKDVQVGAADLAEETLDVKVKVGETGTGFAGTGLSLGGDEPELEVVGTGITLGEDKPDLTV